MSLKQPTQGASGAGLWDDDWDDNAELIDAHDHTTGKGTRVPTAGININADLTFSSLYAPTNLHRLTFASIVALSSDNKSLFVSSADNELYWRSNAGTNVKLTSGASLNVAAFTGGIGGDYAAVGAAVAYDDAADRYTFKQQSPGNWARLACGPVRLFEFNTSESVYVELAAPAALGASYTLTWPTSPDPTSSGVSRPLIVGTTGNVSTMPGPQAGIMYPIQLATPGSGTTLGSTLALGTSVASSYLPIPVPVGAAVSSWTVYLTKTSAAGTISCQLEILSSAGAVTTSGAAATNSANNPGVITLEITGLAGTLTAGSSLRLNLTGGGTTGDSVFAYKAVWT